MDIDRKNFNEYIDKLQGSEFQKLVWAEITRIPRGKTVTYGQIAINLEKPKAVRAVASACGKNPLPLLIPCHRVVAKNGIGGFAYSLELKRWLLELET